MIAIGWDTAAHIGCYMDKTGQQDMPYRESSLTNVSQCIKQCERMVYFYKSITKLLLIFLNNVKLALQFTFLNSEKCAGIKA